tara:strand:+ start:120 stop:317 length:198 start_codon:yes stop_codon:yes gene_type:complete
VLEISQTNRVENLEVHLSTLDVEINSFLLKSGGDIALTFNDLSLFLNPQQARKLYEKLRLQLGGE